MSYRIDLFDIPGASTVMDSLFVPTISVKGWSDRINSPGSLVFSMHKYDPAATDENLRMWRAVQFFRKASSGYVPKWCGYITAKREVGDRIEVVCDGALEILKKRLTWADQHFTGEGSDEVFGLLDKANDDQDTGIVEGTGDVTVLVNLTLNQAPIFSAMEEIMAAASQGGGEFRVNAEWTLDAVQSLGSDKSETVELIFRRDGQPGSNVAQVEIAEEGLPMANKVWGSGGGFSSEYTHPTSTDDYPLLVERKNFNYVGSQVTLDALTEAYGKQRAFPIPNFRAVAASEVKKYNPITGQRETATLEVGDLEVGDLVLVTVITPNRDISVAKRIAEIVVDVDENLEETMRFGLTEAGVFVTESYLGRKEIEDLKERLARVEATL